MKLFKITLLIASFTLLFTEFSLASQWTKAQIGELSSMSLTSLEVFPDPTNSKSDNPDAISFGKKLFFDKRFSSNGEISCATCHIPEKNFQDGLPLAIGVGKTNSRTMPIVGAINSPFLFWDGRKDSLWSQALGPLENRLEHGGTRSQYAHLIKQFYRTEYEHIFGKLPDLKGIPLNAGPVEEPKASAAWNEIKSDMQELITEIFVNTGKAIAAYERTIKPSRTRFDDYVDELAATGNTPKGLLSEDEQAGLALFIGKANCSQCHNGPMLTNNDFHNTGVPARAGISASRGRIDGVNKVLNDEFNCRSRWSDANPENCIELEFLISKSSKLEGAFKVPSLRNVTNNAPYMHAGQYKNISDVLHHYNNPPLSRIGKNELVRLQLSPSEIKQIEAFLKTLSY